MFLSAVHLPSLEGDTRRRAELLLRRTPATIEWETRLNSLGHAVQVPRPEHRALERSCFGLEMMMLIVGIWCCRSLTQVLLRVACVLLLSHRTSCLQNWGYSHFLSMSCNPELSLRAWGGMEPLVHTLDRVAVNLLYPLLFQMMRRVMKLDTESAQVDKLAIINSVLDDVDTALEANGGPYITGELRDNLAS